MKELTHRERFKIGILGQKIEWLFEELVEHPEREEEIFSKIKSNAVEYYAITGQYYHRVVYAPQARQRGEGLG